MTCTRFHGKGDKLYTCTLSLGSSKRSEPSFLCYTAGQYSPCSTYLVPTLYLQLGVPLVHSHSSSHVHEGQEAVKRGGADTYRLEVAGWLRYCVILEIIQHGETHCRSGSRPPQTLPRGHMVRAPRSWSCCEPLAQHGVDQSPHTKGRNEAGGA
jgi:hypothetical protein